MMNQTLYNFTDQINEISTVLINYTRIFSSKSNYMSWLLCLINEKRSYHKKYKYGVASGYVHFDTPFLAGIVVSGFFESDTEEIESFVQRLNLQLIDPEIKKDTLKNLTEQVKNLTENIILLAEDFKPLKEEIYHVNKDLNLPRLEANSNIQAVLSYCIHSASIYYSNLLKKLINNSRETNRKELKKDMHIGKPLISEENVIIINSLLKGFFYPKDHTKLEELLKTGNDLEEPLLFLKNGIHLADSFKQLIKSDVITGCELGELESWIYRNFKYIYRKEIKYFNHKYLKDIISSNQRLCKNPILKVLKDKSTGNISITKA